MASFKIYNIELAGGEATVDIPVVFPGADKTGETLTIRSMYSAAFREGQASISRQIQSLRLANKGEPLDEATLEELEFSGFATLIANWSFEEPCTPANVIEFLRANPQMKDIVSMQCSKDSLFFKKGENK